MILRATYYQFPLHLHLFLEIPLNGPLPCRFVCPKVVTRIFTPHLGTCIGLFSRIMTDHKGQRDELDFPLAWPSLSGSWEA